LNKGELPSPPLFFYAYLQNIFIHVEFYALLTCLLKKKSTWIMFYFQMIYLVWIWF